jgi:hypothetical protein
MCLIQTTLPSGVFSDSPFETQPFDEELTHTSRTMRDRLLL